MSRFYARMQQRRGTAAQWTASNPILQAGELGYETDTEQFKIGNGTSNWNDLDYWEGSLPDQVGNSGKFLTTDGTDASWTEVDALPDQASFAGYFLTTDGSVASWAEVDALPSQTGNDGYYLKTDGSVASWAEVDALPSQTGNAGYYLKTDGTTASWDELSIDDLVTVNVGDLGDVTITGTPADGEVLTYDGTNWVNEPLDIPAGTTISSTAPASPEAGDLWWDSDNGNLYIYYNDGSSSQWVSASDGQAVISDTAPTGYNGQIWWNSDEGKMYVFYDDGTSSAWVAAGGPQVTVQATPPAGYQGQMWLDSTDGSMYVYYTDPGGGSSQWIGAVSRSGGILQVVSTTKTDTFSASVAAGGLVSVTGFSASLTPRSTSSKILVFVAIDGSASTADGHMSFRLLRNGSPVGVGDAAESRASLTTSQTPAYASNNTSMANAMKQFLDTPATTSTTTYSVEIHNSTYSSQTLYVNRSSADFDNDYVPRTISTITLMEVAG